MSGEGSRIDIVTPNDNFWKILSAFTKRPIQNLKDEFLGRRFVALDPGETTGLAFWNKGEIRLQQAYTKEVGEGYLALDDLIRRYCPDHLRVEEYRVYSWMADSHSWSVLHTPQLIGAIKVISSLRNLPISFKLAQQPKAVWNDETLKMAGLYSPGMKHARDAQRHLLYYMALPDKTD